MKSWTVSEAYSHLNTMWEDGYIAKFGQSVKTDDGIHATSMECLVWREYEKEIRDEFLFGKITITNYDSDLVELVCEL